MFAAAALTLSFALNPIDLGTITADRARLLDGRRVTASLLVTKPPYTWSGDTVVGAADQDDAAERVAVLAGERLDVDVGERIEVRGVLLVIDHPPAVVSGVLIEGWAEIRVEEDG
jgi:hypothetical protein